MIKLLTFFTVIGLSIPAFAELNCRLLFASFSRQEIESLIPDKSSAVFIPGKNIRKASLKDYKNDDEARVENKTMKDDQEYVKAMDQIEEVIKEKFPKHHGLPLAFYIASGTDAAIAHHIFAPTLSVGVDRHPFMNKEISSDQKFDAFPITGTTFRHTSDIDYREEPLGPALVGSFYRHLPGFRSLGIYIFNTKEQVSRYDKTKQTASHGLLIFDTGNGTQVRGHLQIQAIATFSTRIEEQWWYKSTIESFGSQFALIEKASHGTYDYETASGIKYEENMGNVLRETIKQNHGVWIEGSQFNNSHNSWQFFILDEVKDADKVEIFKTPKWGYNGQVRIVGF